MVGQRRAYLFDQVSTGDPGSVLRMNARVATCYTWAEAHGFAIADEIIAWADGSRPVVDVLNDLLAMCHSEQAALLIHSVDVLPGPIAEPWRDAVPLVVATEAPRYDDPLPGPGTRRRDEADCGC
jgi:hypothetical protein